MSDALELVIHALEWLRTPALLFLVALVVWGALKLKAIEKALEGKAELQALNGVGAKVRKLELAHDSDTSKTRIAVAALAQKCDAPDVIKDFLR